MLEKFYHPEHLVPEQLDHLLEHGWFRMGQSVFTTDYVLFDARLYPALWLRHDLERYREGKTLTKLRKRNRNFRATLHKARITEEHEGLYRLYRNAVPFDVSSSLMQLLYGYGLGSGDVFNTYQIDLRDGDELIASSYFDIGRQSAEGISSFYHPEYREQSLGKYLIYLQIQVCQGNGIKWYYPGYFVPGYAHLDYKLGIGPECLSYFERKDAKWLPIAAYAGVGVELTMKEVLEKYSGYRSKHVENFDGRSLANGIIL
ncbi:MAG: arginine-tRNA-protein transferase [Bacteroidota bacterium]|nr:MAG: arginine-tRNA-protein transferase [Bacteroidota bacterium]